MPAYYHELIGQAADLHDAAGGWGGDFDDGTLDSVKPSPTALDPAEVELFALKSSWDVVKACDRPVKSTQLPLALCLFFVLALPLVSDRFFIVSPFLVVSFPVCQYIGMNPPPFPLLAVRACIQARVSSRVSRNGTPLGSGSDTK